MEVARLSVGSARSLAGPTPIADRSTRASSARPAAIRLPCAFRQAADPAAVVCHRSARPRGAFIVVVLATLWGGSSCAISTVDSPGYARGANQGVNTGFTPTTSFDLPPRSQSCSLDLLAVGQTPARAIVPIGPVTTHTEGAGEDRDMAVIRLKERACMVGAHGLMQINASAGGRWTEDGTYVWVAEGTATAFVYVDMAGRPLPAPGAAPVAFAVPPAPRMPPPPASGAK